VLFEHIEARAFPVVYVGDDLLVAVNGQFAPASDRNPGFPRQWSIPAHCPASFEQVLGWLDAMQFQAQVFEPGGNKADHFLVLAQPRKVVHRIFEVHIGTVDTVGLGLGEFGVVGFDDFDQFGSFHVLRGLSTALL
jgi:hypothetical protein